MNAKYSEFFNMQKKKYIITEAWKKPEKLSDGKKSEVNISMDDVASVPTRFKLYFIFTIKFICSEIRKKYEDTSVQNTQTQVQKSMASKQTSMISIEPKFVDYKSFYLDVIQKNFSSKSIKSLLNKFIESGTYNLEDFFISKVTNSLVDGKTMNDIILWKAFIQKDKKNLKSSPISIKFGLAIEFTASNMYKNFSRTDVLKLSKIFIPEFENSIFKDSLYYTVSKPNALVSKTAPASPKTASASPKTASASNSATVAPTTEPLKEDEDLWTTNLWSTKSPLFPVEEDSIDEWTDKPIISLDDPMYE